LKIHHLLLLAWIIVVVLWLFEQLRDKKKK